MAEELREKLSKVMAERRSGAAASPTVPQEQADPVEAIAPAGEANAEWKAFYEEISSYVKKIQE